MAEEDDSQKTEEPTAKKLREAEQKGKVASSQELKTLVMMIATLAILAGYGGWISNNVAMRLRNFISNVHEISSDQTGLLEVLGGLGLEVFYIMLLPFSILIVAAIISNRTQHKFTLTAEKLKPDIKNLSLLKGAKKIFGKKIFIEFGKIVGKLTAVGGTIFLIAYPERARLDTMMLLPPIEILSAAHIMAIKLILGVIIIMIIIAAVDFSFQKYQHHKDLRMTKQEVKDEQKQTDGDPKVKARLRAIRFERHAQRMMAAIPNADVVITNPTHFAVALEYKHESMAVPVLIAKGIDDVALRIRERAEEYDIPILENPPLARALHASVELDQEIPPDHYKAVAEVISYIMKLKRAGLKAS
jgi:flagellar biosynthetic protein FlhB